MAATAPVPATTAAPATIAATPQPERPPPPLSRRRRPTSSPRLWSPGHRWSRARGRWRWTTSWRASTDGAARRGRGRRDGGDRGRRGDRRGRRDAGGERERAVDDVPVARADRPADGHRPTGQRRVERRHHGRAGRLRDRHRRVDLAGGVEGVDAVGHDGDVAGEDQRHVGHRCRDQLVGGRCRRLELGVGRRRPPAGHEQSGARPPRPPGAQPRLHRTVGRPWRETLPTGRPSRRRPRRAWSSPRLGGSPSARPRSVDPWSTCGAPRPTSPSATSRSPAARSTRRSRARWRRSSGTPPSSTPASAWPG